MTTRLRPGPQGVEWQHGTHSGYHNHKCRCEPCRDASRKHKAVPRSIYLARVHAKARETNHGTALASDDPRHGTANGYNNQHCRCQRCRDAWTAYFTAYRHSRGWSLPAAEWERIRPKAQHGRKTMYNKHKCRCRICRDGARDRQRADRARMRARQSAGGGA